MDQFPKKTSAREKPASLQNVDIYSRFQPLSFKEIVKTNQEDHVGSFSDYSSQIATGERPDFFGGGNITEQYFAYLFNLIKREQNKATNTRVTKSVDGIFQDSALRRVLNDEAIQPHHPAPSLLRTTNISDTSIKIKWETPAKYPVQYYVSITRSDQNKDNLVTESEYQREDRVSAFTKEYLFPGLEDSSEYLISVLALYADGVKSNAVNITVHTCMLFLP